MAHSDRHLRGRLARLEQEAREQPRRHAVRMALYIALGYLWPFFLLLLCTLCAAGVLGLFFLAWHSGVTDILGWLLMLGAIPVVGFLLLATAPAGEDFLPGQPVTAAEAPALFALISEVQKAAAGPVIDAVRLDCHVNAAILHRRRRSARGERNCLVLGVPLLAALTPGDLRAVIAHELGHLGGRVDPFGGWVYRVVRTWHALVESPPAKRTLHDRLMGWFARWYVPWLISATIPLRRLHEYKADQASAQWAGATTTARALAALDWATYRLGRRFQPALWLEAHNVDLPPGDYIQRVVAYWATAPEAGNEQAWREYELRRKSQLSDEHPSLMERLTALGSGQLLEGAPDGYAVAGVPASLQPEGSALMLLGEHREKAVKQMNLLWKGQVIAGWRRAHAVAEYLAREAAEEEGDAVAAKRWAALQADFRYRDPVAARGLIAEFLTAHPEHAEAHFDFGRLLLHENDDGGCVNLEKAMEIDSDYGPAALNLMLDYFREAGRDVEADAVQARARAFQQRLSSHTRFTQRLSPREALMPHDLARTKLRRVWSGLNRFPQLGEAYLAKRSGAVLKDKPVYVLAVCPRSVTVRLDGRVLKAIQASMPMPCTVVCLSWWKRRLRQRMMGVCAEAVFRG